MVNIEFNNVEEKKDNVEDMAMEELSSIPSPPSNEGDNEELGDNDFDEEEFGEVDLDDNEIDFSIGGDNKEKVSNECKLSALFDYLFFFYFMGLALMYKELRNKGKFVNEFIEKNKQAIEDIKIRIERCLSNSLPNTYEKLIKFDDYAFILGILMLSINFHVEVQDAIANHSQEPVKNVKNEVSKKKSETTHFPNENIKSNTKEVVYDEQW